MAAMIEGQREGILTEIVADIEENAAVYRDPMGLALPIAAVVAEGVRQR
jgi:hypothetical protein